MRTINLTFREFVNFSKVIRKGFETVVKKGQINVTCDTCKLEEYGY